MTKARRVTLKVTWYESMLIRHSLSIMRDLTCMLGCGEEPAQEYRDLIRKLDGQMPAIGKENK